MKEAVLKIILRRSSSDLASGSDSFKNAQINNEPGKNKTAKEFPAKPTKVLDATGFLQKPMTGIIENYFYTE